jgi:hypothetical protein
VSQANLEIVRSAWDACERRDMETLFALYDSEIVWDQTPYGGAELAALYNGHDGISRFLGEWLAPFESYYAQTACRVEGLGDGDRVLRR